MPLSVMEKEKLRKSFATFDADGSGKLTKDEMMSIFTREGGGAPLSSEVAEMLIAEFDKNGDGELDLDEFIDCWAAVGEAGEAGDLATTEGFETNKYYDRPFNDHKEAITDLFELLDTDDSQYIEINEMKEVVTFYSGDAFVEADFLSWYDSNGSSKDEGPESDGKFDLKEFGWYIADCAECDSAKMPDEIAKFKAAIEYVNDRKKKHQSMSTHELFAEVQEAKV